jgi:hypothetical protein
MFIYDGTNQLLFLNVTWMGLNCRILYFSILLHCTVQWLLQVIFPFACSFIARWFSLSFTICFGLHGHLQVCRILHIFIFRCLRTLFRCFFFRFGAFFHVVTLCMFPSVGWAKYEVLFADLMPFLVLLYVRFLLTCVFPLFSVVIFVISLCVWVSACCFFVLYENIWRFLHTWRWPCRPKDVVKDSENQHTIKQHADGDITCKTHWTIQCSRMLKYSILQFKPKSYHFSYWYHTLSLLMALELT